MNPSLVLLLVCFIQMASLGPIVEPRRPQYFAPLQPVASSNHFAEADDFMRTHGVTGEEIQEYNRMSGFNPPAGTDMAEERSFGLPDAIKFWNWSMFDNFRQWVTGRRQIVTTNSSPVLISPYDRQASTISNILPLRL
ncbi:Uncharacterized protein APZ42_014352 [Daphnia magna]|uniref:Uncharacterized protein n=2 Tax=Daphnia magna TaxID=35525 RepID=A0A162Q7Q4_9CRUS|nr:hypothetical protein OUZ56_028495 [Daphnia magna]KZS19432.1 Uncharacterized protein APZ42_014352 [Daphnia magna]